MLTNQALDAVNFFTQFVSDKADRERVKINQQYMRDCIPEAATIVREKFNVELIVALDWYSKLGNASDSDDGAFETWKRCYSAVDNAILTAEIDGATLEFVGEARLVHVEVVATEVARLKDVFERMRSPDESFEIKIHEVDYDRLNGVTHTVHISRDKISDQPA